MIGFPCLPALLRLEALFDLLEFGTCTRRAQDVRKFSTHPALSRGLAAALLPPLLHYSFVFQPRARLTCIASPSPFASPVHHPVSCCSRRC